jgi:phenylpropionate dioxygenase-like ring-hydroxylating dioxygenase large terminal subunit
VAIRALENDKLPIPNGWFAIAWSHELRPGDVKDISYFGEEMVLFRTRSGVAKVLDPFCPHLGAHLGHGGRVMGETIRCPFHGWQFDGATGECTHIPYCDRIPGQARLRPWSTQEKNGLIWAWYHAEAKPPEWDFPEIPEIGHADWSEPTYFDLEFDAHIQETHENNNDPVHFQYVHGMPEAPPSEITFSEDGRHYQIVSHMQREMPTGTFDTSLVRDSWGLGLNAIWMTGIPQVGSLLYAASTPVDENRVHSRWLLTATKNCIDFVGEEIMSSLKKGVYDDFPIWKHKVYRDRPVLCEADTYLAQYRKWAKQFYSNPVANATTEMTRSDQGE